jgi:hypothetical protein
VLKDQAYCEGATILPRNPMESGTPYTYDIANCSKAQITSDF